MKKQAHNPVNRKLSESDETASKPTGAVSGEFVTETFEYDGGRQVTVYVPPDPHDDLCQMVLHPPVELARVCGNFPGSNRHRSDHAGQVTENPVLQESRCCSQISHRSGSQICIVEFAGGSMN